MALTKVSYSMIEGAIVNVLDFGADPTGNSDSTAAIQAAVDSLTKGTIYFPNGSYSISSTIEIDGVNQISINFVGTGLGSEIVYDGTTPNDVMFYYNGGSNTAFVLVENLRFRNAFKSSNTALNGIIAWRIGKKDPAALDGNGGTCNVTFRKNQILYCDYGLEIWAESDQITIEDNYFFVWNDYAIWCGTNPLSVTGTGNASVRVLNNQLAGGQDGSWAIKFRGANVTAKSNVIQNVNDAGGIWLDNLCTGFNISNNYTESTGNENFIFLDGASDGSIYDNQIGGYPGASIINIGATSKNINIGQNFYPTSGGAPAYLIFIDPAATGVNILGAQRQDVPGGGGINGPRNLQIDGSGNLTALTSVKSPLITSVQTNVNVNASSAVTLFTAVAYGCYLVNVSQGQEDYSATAIVTVIGDTATVNVNSIYSTNVNLSITATGLDVKVNNGLGATRTVFYGYIRIA